MAQRGPLGFEFSESLPLEGGGGVLGLTLALGGGAFVPQLLEAGLFVVVGGLQGPGAGPAGGAFVEDAGGVDDDDTSGADTGVLGADVDLATVRLKDVGRVGGDAARNLVQQLKHEHPVTFWSMAGVAAAGAATLGYTRGTDALEKLGIRPEASSTLFDGAQTKLRATVAFHAGPKLADPALSLGLRGERRFDNGTVVHGALQTRLQGKELGETRVSGSVQTTSGFSATGEIRLSGNDFQPIDAHMLVIKQFDRWNVGADANYTFHNNRFTSTLSAGRTFDIYQPGDLDLQIRGSFDNVGNRFIGLGATFRF